jgi:outer membrane murein-binding lipoprotein Lpp
MTGVGPTSPPINAGSFSQHKSKSKTTSSNVNSIKKKIEQLQKDLEQMKQ